MIVMSRRISQIEVTNEYVTVTSLVFQWHIKTTSRERPKSIDELRRGRQMFLEEFDRYLSALFRNFVIAAAWTSWEISPTTSTTFVVVAFHHCSDIFETTTNRQHHWRSVLRKSQY